MTFLLVLLVVLLIYACWPKHKTAARSSGAQTPKDWAASVLSSNAVILDCETTGISAKDEIIQLAIVDMQGNTLFNSLIKPSPRKRISSKAQATHGITREMLKDAPAFGEVMGEVLNIINNRKVITYNAEFDRRMLLQTISKYPDADVGGMSHLKAVFDCAMKPYAVYVGEWAEWKKDYKWQKLPGGDHSALGDCLATLAVIRKMAC